MEDSLALQRLGLERQRTALRMIFPIVIVVILALLFLVLRYSQRCAPTYLGQRSFDSLTHEE